MPKSKYQMKDGAIYNFVYPLAHGRVLSIEECMKFTLTNQHPINDRAQRNRYVTFGF